ncbi:tripartite motif containing 105 isoform X1 [Brienomyrus brachyistius]|uniref:tripartite motif containing 105 isoform X1 n=1 Tax=Brienomyrus brachyistius TaxID=42636 RepID=UPI0020B425B1|nr:tripartite motif containing 105 isoform X1 [Brienomyrus brachyistius]XP_048884787.1 tripartite motif containing 105 isoform X1 [Brienomyrus brachyistius]XP_048884788.1 tripartite motif containing 105 isoform X1 [Brienomyrus brachyistius]
MSGGVTNASQERLSLKEDLTCAICYDLFNDPVMLACMHHFCKSCIATYWRSIRGPVTCPQCRQEFPTKQFQTNYLVAAMVEKVRARSADHQDRQKQLKDCLASHLSMKERYMGMIHKSEQKVLKIKRTGAELQGQIRSDFQALHCLLQEEEASTLEHLRREQEEMLGELGRHLAMLQGALVEVEEKMHNLQQTMDAMEQRYLLETPEVNFRLSVEVDKGPGIDISSFGAKYKGPLQYIVWRKMFKLLNPGPAPLTFDEETAHPSLCLSRDKTAVVECDKMVAHKPSPKRFVQCINILGSQGFQSGRHYWEVGVENKTKWDLGVALETVDRGARVKLCPENGYWTLRLRNKTQYSAGTQPWTPLTLRTSPRTIGVFLDFEDRRVSFYNADTMLMLCSFNNGPNQKAFPFFSTCLSDQGRKPQLIRLVHFPLEPL